VLKHLKQSHHDVSVTLEPDVAEHLKAMARRRTISFEAASNAAVREGLAAERGENASYRVPSRPMGSRPGLDLTHALQLADSSEDDETLRRLELRT
jgi:hypothetical protein